MRLISHKPLSFNWPEALPPVMRDGYGTHLRAAWCLQARGKSLWPLWQEDLDFGKLTLQGMENLRVFPRADLFNRHVWVCGRHLSRYQ